MFLISILIPTILERGEQFSKMVNNLYTQIKENKLEKKVEIIYISDNRTVPLSVKRNLLQKMSQGKFFTHLDDDDNFTDDYCITVVNHIELLIQRNQNLPDVIGYNQLAFVKDTKFIVKSSIDGPLHLVSQRDGFFTHEAYQIPVYHRFAWQYNLWSERFKKVYRTDSDTNSKEDQNWLKKVMLEYPTTYSHIDKILHEYHFEVPENSTCQ